MRSIITVTTIIVNVLSMIGMIVGVLLHSGRGGGAAALGSASAERNLSRITTVLALVWLLTVTALGILLSQ